jgi:hypothetical protein
MRRHTLVLAGGLLLLLAGGVRAQQLERVLDHFAAAWARGDAAGIAALVSRAGVSIDPGNGSVGPLGARQAAAMLRRIFDDRETTVVRAGTAQIVGGAPPRAFGEIAWAARSRGTTESENATVFLALIRERDGWRITQIRLLR